MQYRIDFIDTDGKDLGSMPVTIEEAKFLDFPVTLSTADRLNFAKGSDFMINGVYYHTVEREINFDTDNQVCVWHLTVEALGKPRLIDEE